MPQLQIKVPTLRRWGVKTAVITDKGFFSALGPMQCVDDLSNGDIMWFVVDYEKKSPYEAVLKPAFTRYITLEHAVEGLTAGVPISKNEFEIRIRQKLLGSRSRQSK